MEKEFYGREGRYDIEITSFLFHSPNDKIKNKFIFHSYSSFFTFHFSLFTLIIFALDKPGVVVEDETDVGADEIVLEVGASGA